ncbi:MAG: hypothetical protein LBT90_01350 [Holosporaceae bacterium]|jgi:hypothetical protein|nr:hypothetical protein [Holosporaceae bacterium]
MKKLILVAVSSMMVLYAEAVKYHVCNEAWDSFDVSVFTNDSRVVISTDIHDYDPTRIEGRARPEAGGRGGRRCEKYYEVTFKDEYVPSPGKEPFISFRNDKGEFKLMFFDEHYAELRSDTASAIHDDSERREYDRTHYIPTYRKEDEYTGNTRHWMIVDPYAIVYCYEMYYFPKRCIEICDALEDNSWIQSTKEIECDAKIRSNPPRRYPRQPESSGQHWWSRLSCCDSCCTD